MRFSDLLRLHGPLHVAGDDKPENVSLFQDRTLYQAKPIFRKVVQRPSIKGTVVCFYCRKDLAAQALSVYSKYHERKAGTKEKGELPNVAPQSQCGPSKHAELTRSVFSFLFLCLGMLDLAPLSPRKLS